MIERAQERKREGVSGGERVVERESREERERVIERGIEDDRERGYGWRREKKRKGEGDRERVGKKKERG